MAVGNKRQKKGKRFYQKFFLDGLLNYLFFPPIITVLSVLPVFTFFGIEPWNLDSIIPYMITSLFVSFLAGGLFGRVLNAWRKKLNYN